MREVLLADTSFKRAQNIPFYHTLHLGFYDFISCISDVVEWLSFHIHTNRVPLIFKINFETSEKFKFSLRLELLEKGTEST